MLQNHFTELQYRNLRDQHQNPMQPLNIDFSLQTKIKIKMKYNPRIY